MKRCPKCGQGYTESDINFCLNDGELLLQYAPDEPKTMFADDIPPTRFGDDSPPTVMMDRTRVTNPTNWQYAPPPANWGGQQPGTPQQQTYAPYGINASPSQTLAIVSMCLGLGSMTIGWCCSLGLLLSPAALITGFIAFSQTKKDPARYGGRGFAIGGIVAGGLFLGLYVLVMLIYGAAIFFGGGG